LKIDFFSFSPLILFFTFYSSCSSPFQVLFLFLLSNATNSCFFSPLPLKHTKVKTYYALSSLSSSTLKDFMQGYGENEQPISTHMVVVPESVNSLMIFFYFTFFFLHCSCSLFQLFFKSLQETCHLATVETVGKGLKSRWYRS